MKFRFHGAAKEVGRSCIEVSFSAGGKPHRILLDCGIKIGPNLMEHPSKIDYPNEIDAVFLSHAHLDHTGHLPNMMHEGLKCPIYCTAATKETTNTLLEDAHKIEMSEHQHPGYEQKDIEEVMRLVRDVQYRQEVTSNINARFTFYDAGHIPGSGSIVLNIAGKKILYTGDIKTEDTLLLRGADTNYREKIDVMIIESTYGSREHPIRKETEERFLKRIHETLSNNGSVIIPVFAVGRAQEIIMLLDREKFTAPIYFEGMGKRVTQKYLTQTSFLRDPVALKIALKDVHFLKDEKDRRAALESPGIFVSTAGMLTGGPVVSYIEHLGKDRKNSILLTGYQGEGTNGRFLMEQGFIYANSRKVFVKAHYEQFDFSAHAGSCDLKRLIEKIRPRITMINHGDPHEAEALGEFAKTIGSKVYVPEFDEEIDVE